MRCELCLLQTPEAAELPLNQLAERLKACEGCEIRERSPEVHLLVGRLIEAARALRRAEQRARQSERRHEEIAAELQHHGERVAILEGMQRAGLAEIEAELLAKVALVEEQRRAILALSTPIIRIGERTLALPIIGALDEERASHLTSRLLQEIVALRARYAIVDLTGIGATDEATAACLLRLAQAVRLLGAEVILTGVRSEAARALVEIGAALSALRIQRTIHDALRLCRGAEREVRA